MHCVEDSVEIGITHQSFARRAWLSSHWLLVGANVTATDRSFSKLRYIGHTNPKSAEYAGKSMQQDHSDSEFAGNGASMLSTRSAKTDQRVLAWIVAARDRDL